MKQTTLIIGIGGHVVAIDPATGSEIWRTKLKGADIVTIAEDGDRIYAGAAGQLFAIDRTTGQILWNNHLTGLGLGLIAFGNAADVAAAKRILAERAAAAAAG